MKQDTLLEYGTPQTTQTKGKLVQSCLIASNNRTIKPTFYSFVFIFFPNPFHLFSSHHNKTSSGYSCRSPSLHCMKETSYWLIHIYIEACKGRYCKYLQCKSIKYIITEQQGVPLTLQFYTLHLWWKFPVYEL